MIGILHGYLLEGSGSNLWTRSVVASLCRQGETVHLFCQENHGDLYEFIGEMRRYNLDGSVEIVWKRPAPFPGRCILHKPVLGDTLPVYVVDRYEEFANVVPMIRLADEDIERYIGTNARVIARVVAEEHIQVLHANHCVLMPEVARRVKAEWGTPYVIMPHGSAIEYAVKKDRRFFRFAERSITESAGLFVIGKEIRQRMNTLFPNIPGLDQKMTDLNLGVDTSLFTTQAPQTRKARVQELKIAISGTKRGRKASVLEQFRTSLTADVSKEELMRLLKEYSEYDHKAPDEDAEGKLDSLDWSRESTVLFVGRFIASKGLQAVICALPDILRAHPTTRLLAVGHGPQREALEALLWALENGHRPLAERVVQWGRELEDGTVGPYREIQAYWNGFGARQRDEWFATAQEYIRVDTVVFTGYLTHPMLRHLFPCTDVSVFPSVVPEAGPLVFLEALASGSFPLGTYFAGMAASIDSTVEFLGQEPADAMKLSSDPALLVRDIGAGVLQALGFDGRYRESLREIAVTRYDWKAVGRSMLAKLAEFSKASFEQNHSADR